MELVKLRIGRYIAIIMLAYSAFLGQSSQASPASDSLDQEIEVGEGSARLDFDDEMLAESDAEAKPKPLRLINFEVLMIFNGSKSILRHLPLDARLTSSKFVGPDSVVLAGHYCHFRNLRLAPCAKEVDKLPVPQLLELLELLELLGHILVYVNQPLLKSPLSNFRHYLATIFASHSVLNAAWDVAKAAASYVTRYYAWDFVRDPAGYVAWDAAWDVARDAGAWGAAWEATSAAARDAVACAAAGAAALASARETALASARETAGLAPTAAALYPAQAAAAGGAMPEVIRQQAFVAAEQPALASLVKNAAITWEKAHEAALTILNETVSALPAAPYFAMWLKEHRQNDFLKPYLRVIDLAVRNYKKSFARNAGNEKEIVAGWSDHKSL